MLKTYMKLLDGSHNVSVILCNLMGKPVHWATGRCVVQMIATNAILDTNPSPRIPAELDKLEPSPKPKKLTIPERQKLLLELLKKDAQLDKLNILTPDLALKFERMLMKHHHIFSLEPNETWCTNMAEHVIELLDMEPFKE